MRRARRDTRFGAHGRIRHRLQLVPGEQGLRGQQQRLPSLIAATLRGSLLRLL
jgi:hypothetical protein